MNVRAVRRESLSQTKNAITLRINHHNLHHFAVKLVKKSKNIQRFFNIVTFKNNERICR